MTCLLLLGMTTSQAADDRPLTHTFPKSVIDEVERRDTPNIGFEGNEKFSSTALRRALAIDDNVIKAVWADQPSLEKWSGVSWAEYAATVADRVLAGYQLGAAKQLTTGNAAMQRTGFDSSIRRERGLV